MEEGISSTRLQADPPQRFVRLRKELGVSTFGMNQMVLGPGEEGRIHSHTEQEEVFLVLEGTLLLLVEGEEHVFERDELVRVAPILRRKIVNGGEGRLVLLALGGANPHESGDGLVFDDWVGGQERDGQKDVGIH
jgi:mannose-6-phosphate isomerase-like protein (cupin superfamily)